MVACQGNENQKDVLLQSPLYHRNLSGLFKLKPQSLRQVLFSLVHHYVGKLRLGPDGCFSGVSVPINCQAWLPVLPFGPFGVPVTLLHCPFPPATSNFFRSDQSCPALSISPTRKISTNRVGPPGAWRSCGSLQTSKDGRLKEGFSWSCCFF